MRILRNFFTGRWAPVYASTMRSAFVLAIFTACGQSDASRDPDAGELPVGSDGRTAMTGDVVCEDYVRTVRYATGGQYVYTYRYGLVRDVTPDDDFTVELCGYYPDPVQSSPCPDGATCTGTSAPAGSQCHYSYRSGTFVDGKLLVNCGWRLQQFAANGTITSTTESGYASIRVERR